ncbi:acylneuraminate cytidylyltransferase family protein [Sphingobacterium faecium]|uniref:acylneuraminate cytidylyltransferase family protein n=1 Tax=Sphingobacterium faecium TaxID=34087 RepID=UPI00320B4F87
MKRKYIAFIPLRKGSRGIVNKNNKVFNEKPLFQWVLDTVLLTAYFDEVWIATNDEEIKENVKKLYGESIKVFDRSEENATDFSPTIDVVKEFLNSCSFNNNDMFMLFQATSPLTQVEDIYKVISSTKDNNFDSIVTCHRLYSFKWSENGLSLDYNLSSKPRRQDYKGFLVESGAIYASKIEAIKNSGNLLSGNIGIVEISKYASIDIDEWTDWNVAHVYYREMKGFIDG